MGKDITLNIEATMPERWASQFLGMLNHMEKLGKVGSSRCVIFYADGDGDFHPKFFFSCPSPDSTLPEMSKGVEADHGDIFFDAG